MLSLNNAEFTNAVEPINKVNAETKPLKAACYEPEAATRRQLFEKSWAKTFSFVAFLYLCIFYLPDRIPVNNAVEPINNVFL